MRRVSLCALKKANQPGRRAAEREKPDTEQTRGLQAKGLVGESERAVKRRRNGGLEREQSSASWGLPCEKNDTRATLKEWRSLEKPTRIAREGNGSRKSRENGAAERRHRRAPPSGSKEREVLQGEGEARGKEGEKRYLASGRKHHDSGQKHGSYHRTRGSGCEVGSTKKQQNGGRRDKYMATKTSQKRLFGILCRGGPKSRALSSLCRRQTAAQSP